jgi:ABC-type branched-subunit amino acid transport system substrate-binding protein
MTGYALAEDTIKVGILHSLSGTMAISETILKDVMLMQIAELNAKGGLLGKKVEPVVVDPASNWPLFAEKARELLTRTRSRPCSDAGLRCRANPSCRCLRS